MAPGLSATIHASREGEVLIFRASHLVAPLLLVPLAAEAPRVSYCELAAQSRAYDDVLVRTEADVVLDGESAFLHDASCAGRDAYADVALVCTVQQPTSVPVFTE